MFDLVASDATTISNFGQPEPQVSVSAEPPPGFWSPDMFDTVGAASLLFEQEQLRGELDDLARLPDDWDGEGAVQISRGVIARTWSLLVSTIAESPTPDLTPNSNGTISLEWECGSRFLHLEIGEQDFSILIGGGGNPSLGVQGVGLPPKSLLSALVASVVSFTSNRDTSITAEKIAA